MEDSGLFTSSAGESCMDQILQVSQQVYGRLSEKDPSTQRMPQYDFRFPGRTIIDVHSVEI